MGIRSHILFTLFFMTGFSWSQGTEVQRKYILDDPEFINNIVDLSVSVGELKSEYHSKYHYFDIYVDTKDVDLYKQGFSLRIRKRFMPEEPISYSMQLKTEMIESGDVRLEIEEPELDFYRIKDGNDWISLATIINWFFFPIENTFFDYKVGSYYIDKQDPGTLNENQRRAIELLKKWFQMKAGAAIAPFQKLQTANSTFWTTDKIGELEPILYGYSIRKRSHLYLDKPLDDRFKDLPQNYVKATDLPPFFIEHPKYNWVTETSLDSAVFYTITEDTPKKFEIYEYEVENKYYVDSIGNTILDYFEEILIRDFGAKTETASKYAQCIRQFR